LWSTTWTFPPTSADTGAGGGVDLDDVADRLEAIAEELGDLAFDRLREASSMAGRGTPPDPALVAEEKRLTRARRSVQKAVVTLRRVPGPAPEDA
jgi:hypothetical protein